MFFIVATGESCMYQRSCRECGVLPATTGGYHYCRLSRV